MSDSTFHWRSRIEIVNCFMHRIISNLPVFLMILQATACNNGSAGTPVDIGNPAVISGVDTGNILEDDIIYGNKLLRVNGKLNITDTDPGEAAFVATSFNVNKAIFSIDTAGNWNFTTSNDLSDIQALTLGETIKLELAVSSVDGTTHMIVITLSGADDAAIISGLDTGSIREDDDPDGDNLLTANGKLDITDIDTGQAAFIASDISGDFGKLLIDAEGNWVYSAKNDLAEIQHLAHGTSLTDTLSISSIDGTTHTIVITLSGTDDAAIISGIDTGSIREDDDPDGDNLLTANGKLDITDIDTGQSAFIASDISGDFGKLLIDAEGNWVYSASNDNASIQSLANGATLTDNLTITSLGGTTHQVTITVTSLDIDVSWTAPTLREDNTPILLSEISGYWIYCRTEPGTYSYKVNISDGSAVEYTFKNLSLNTTYYCCVTCYDTDKRESIFSPEIVINN